MNSLLQENILFFFMPFPQKNKQTKLCTSVKKNENTFALKTSALMSLKNPSRVFLYTSFSSTHVLDRGLDILEKRH